nr:hypothetical protein [Tanacetum cinerariifolium]
MRRVGKGFSGVETPLFENMLAVRAVDAEEEVQVPTQDDIVQENVIEEVITKVVPPTPTSPSPPSRVLDKCSALVLIVKGLENANAAQKLEIIKLKARVKKLERLNKVKSSKLRRLKKVGTSQRVESSEDVENVFNQGRMSVDMETDKGIKLEVDQEKDAQEDTKVQEAVEVVTTAKLITEVVTAAATQVATASTPIPAAKPKVLKIAAAPVTRKRKGVVIRDPEEELHVDTLAETTTMKDKGKGILIEDPKPMKKKDQIEMDAEYHGFKKKPQSESEARKNMISYLKNTEGFKMEFFKGKTYDQIVLIFQARFYANLKFLFKTREEMEKEDEEIIKSINETPAQKAVKRRKLNEEAQEADNLRRRLEIVPNKDDDVFVEAVPLAQKVPVVDYQKPTNFSDEYLLLTLKTMFGELDEQDAIWRNQKSVHGLSLMKRWKRLTSCGVHVIILSTVRLFLLVERRYPLFRFTLEQLVNVARLQAKVKAAAAGAYTKMKRQNVHPTRCEDADFNCLRSKSVAKEYTYYSDNAKIDLYYVLPPLLPYLGASVNVMPKSMFRHLKLANLKETNMLVEMVDMTRKTPLEILENILVKINKFIFPSNFIIIDMLREPSETVILEEESFNLLEIGDDLFSYESHVCLLFEQCTQFCDDESIDTVDSSDNMQEPEVEHKNVMNLEKITSRWHVCKLVRVFYENECGKDYEMSKGLRDVAYIQSVGGNRMIFTDFLKNSEFNDNDTSHETTMYDNPASITLSTYARTFLRKIRDVCEKCEKFHGDTLYPSHDEGSEEEEQWESGIKKTNYEPPFVDIETFEIKRYSFEERRSFICITKQLDETLLLGRANRSRFMGMIGKEIDK